MKSYTTLLLTTAITLSLISCNSAQKPEKKPTEEASGTISIISSWARPAGEGTSSAAYLTIHNETASVDTLLGIQTGAAKIAEIHETYKNEEDMMGMRPAGAIIIQPDSNFTLKPGGFHIMLMQLTRELAKGDSLQLVFEFAVFGEKTIAIPVRK